MKRRSFSAGDPAPWFSCKATCNENFHFDTVAGRYIVLTFFGSTGIEKNRQAIHYISTELRHFFDDFDIAFFGVSIDRTDESQQRVVQSLPGLRFFWDFNRTISTLYGAIDPNQQNQSELIYHSFTLVLDPLLRVLQVIPLADATSHNQQLKHILENLPDLDNHASVPLSAPVLILPRVFEPEFCRELINAYEANGGGDSGFMNEKNGQTIGTIDYRIKRRRDFFFDQSEEHESLRHDIRLKIARRLLPEIKKAFEYQVTRIERYLIGCYDGEVNGFFRAHRDNTTIGTAHRRFACTINLNTEEYEGGDLWFPEFGSRTYRAPTGGAAVFSCSLLHEAQPVTKGKRYAFVPFFYDDKASIIRNQNRESIADGILIRNQNEAE